jgi:uncharacterized damage-inducible protein DinB
MSPSIHITQSIRAEYLRYKELAEKAIAQLHPADLTAVPPGGGNSIATICWHVSGNLRSRFSDFLTSDGEKAWRKRDEEFEERNVTREELLAKWQQGWDVLLGALAGLDDAHLHQQVSIRAQKLTVTEALVRSLAHTASHVGQIVYAAKMLRGEQWMYLSIPPGQSETYNQNPSLEKPPTR